MLLNHIELKLFQQIRNPALAHLNSGKYFFDIRRLYACGYVSLSLMKYFQNGDNTPPPIQYKNKPLTFNQAVKRCKIDLGRADLQVHRQINIPLLANYMRIMGNGTFAMVSSDYVPRHTKKELGFIPRNWGHWFNVICIAGRLFPVDAWSAEEFDRSQRRDIYFQQFNPSTGSAIIAPANQVPANQNG